MSHLSSVGLMLNGKLVLVYCDWFWGNLSGIQYALCGGRVDDGVYSGLSCLAVNNSPVSTYWSFGACCDNFEPQGNSSWKLRHPFVGARVGWLTKLGCFTMDFAFKADHTATMVGACLVII